MTHNVFVSVIGTEFVSVVSDADNVYIDIEFFDDGIGEINLRIKNDAAMQLYEALGKAVA